jgi:Holliday junction resolvase RusA-like endonuclease
MRKIAFTVPGVPRGKGRPRFAQRGKFVKAYTDEKTDCYENKVLVCFRQAAPGHQPLARRIPITLKMVAYFPIPASYSNKRKQACYEFLGKPDGDNMLKCMDSLNAVAWEDDSQIWNCTIEKIYTLTPPRLEITMEWDDTGMGSLGRLPR